jgi:uncharacterized protein (TIGR00299 family) protein
MTLGALVDLGVPLEELRRILSTLPLAGWALRSESVTRNSIAATRVHVDLVKTAGAGLPAGRARTEPAHEPAPGHGHEEAHEPRHEHHHEPGHRHEQAPRHEQGHRHEHEHTHGDRVSHVHPHAHAHDDAHDHDDAHAHGDTHRHLDEILAILRAGRLTPRALDWATQVFRNLANAEARVHAMPIEAVHFHEVGAVDAIVDIAGACVGLDWLCTQHDVREFRVSQLRVGRGHVHTEHGTMPVPPPAVLRLLEGFPFQWSASDGERVTPTGAAILATLAQPLGDATVRLQASGYGAGAKEFPDTPNVLRLLLVEPQAPSVAITSGSFRSPAASAAVTSKGSAVDATAAAGAPAAATASPHIHRGRVAVLSTTIDDMQPEFFGHLLSELLAAGALDVQYTPVQMKKARPGTLVTVIAKPEDAERLATLVLQETPTLGMRIAHEERLELERRIVEVQTPYGRAQVKLAVRPDGHSRAIPEYESVRALAAAAHVPIDEVYRAAQQAASDIASR